MQVNIPYMDAMAAMGYVQETAVEDTSAMVVSWSEGATSGL